VQVADTLTLMLQGVMVRDIECEAEWARLLLPDTACSIQERPVSQAVCEEAACPFDQSGDKRWSTGPWGEVSVACKPWCDINTAHIGCGPVEANTNSYFTGCKQKSKYCIFIKISAFIFLSLF
jgi:hypothetical protein